MTHAVTDFPGSDAGGAVPSITQLIDSSIGAGENTGTTALDALRDDLHDEQLIATDPPATSAPGKTKSGKRRHVRTGKPIGRPRGPATAEPASASGPVLDGPVRPRDPTKAELAAMLAQAQADLSSERARHDADKIGELDNLVQMVAIMAFGKIAEERGPHWALNGDEAEKIGKPTAVALAPYAAKLNVNVPWVAAVLAIVDVGWTRVKIDQQNVARFKRESVATSE